MHAPSHALHHHGHSRQLDATTLGFVRASLTALTLLVAVSAFGGGYYGMMGAEGVPLEWLVGSPFATYFVPSLFLFTVIGGACLLASVLSFTGRHSARKAGIVASDLVLFWIGAQLLVIGPVSWLQPVTVVFALAINLLAWLLPEAQSSDGPRTHRT